APEPKTRTFLISFSISFVVIISFISKFVHKKKCVTLKKGLTHYQRTKISFLEKREEACRFRVKNIRM
ncbi:MAG: hypothetical protein K2P55_11380, partial [Bacteroides acidifaciens]|nr:hypothetical protein [Bacteroides acidifaciens]